jgi:outer membrane autotransporter protein
MKQIRHLFLVITFGMGFLTAPRAQVTYFGVNSSNATTGIMNLTATELDDDILSSPNTLAVGSNLFNYATVYFVPSNTGNYKFGQSSAPVDTVMILYAGIFNASNPGASALVGNDDTDESDHRITTSNPTLNTLCGVAVNARNYCPRVSSGVTAGQRYTLLISTYNPGEALGLPLSFYSDGLGSFYASSVSTYHSNTISNRRFVAGNAAQVLDNLYANPGAMSGVISALDNLSGVAQANAISQTLPVITGASSQATTASMQALNQVIQGRSNSLRGMASGDEYIGNRDMWMKGFGSWANQADVNGVSGYKINTGGLAIGVDQGFTPKLNIGAVLALSNSGVSSNSNTAPSGVTINSYQAGVYGDYAIDPKIIANAQADIGINQNKEYRNITFMGTNANGNYNSYSAHLGTGVKYLMPINPENTFIPSVRVDYTTVQSQAYSESGAGALNLSVAKQTYNTLIPSADVRIDHSLDSKMTLSANAGAGYNTLNNQVSATSAYAGGGTTFATNGLQVSPWLYNAGVGVTGQIDKNLQLNVRYDNVFSPTGYMNQMISAKLKIPL